MLAVAALAGCGSGNGPRTGSTGNDTTPHAALKRAKPGHRGDVTARQGRSATRACAPIRQLPAPPVTPSAQAAVAIASTLEQPTLATGAQLDRIARAHTRTNQPLVELADAYKQLATAYNALATVSTHGNSQLLSALEQRALTAARIVVLQARALGLHACAPRVR